jgi:hypothetical protein
MNNVARKRGNGHFGALVEWVKLVATHTFKEGGEPGPSGQVATTYYDIFSAI